MCCFPLLLLEEGEEEEDHHLMQVGEVEEEGWRDLKEL